jgi:hypothetical protein
MYTDILDLVNQGDPRDWYTDILNLVNQGDPRDWGGSEPHATFFIYTFHVLYIYIYIYLYIYIYIFISIKKIIKKRGREG